MKGARPHKFEQIGRQNTKLIDAFSLLVLAEAQKIDAMKAYRIDHIALDPSFIVTPFLGKVEGHLDPLMVRHDFIGLTQAQRNNRAQMWTCHDFGRQHNSQAELDHLRLPETAHRIVNGDYTALRRVLANPHLGNLPLTTIPVNGSHTYIGP